MCSSFLAFLSNIVYDTFGCDFMKVLLHICCAPCSVKCIEKLRSDNIDILGYWYNPNIHPYMEYKSRRDTLVEYSKSINLDVIYNDYYGLKSFCSNVINTLDNRCGYCYYCRLEETAKKAKELGLEYFSTTLLISPYQNHELLKRAGEEIAKKYGIKFYYDDFRPLFRDGQNKAREIGLYMQKYCGCVFSEEERYSKQIEKDKEKFFSR